MKKRNGFVTNSSSSSFVCAVCGYGTGGYDMSYADASMYACSNCGNDFCMEEAVVHENDIEFLAKIMPEVEDIVDERLRTLAIDGLKLINSNLGRSMERFDFTSELLKGVKEYYGVEYLTQEVREKMSDDHVINIFSIDDANVHWLFCPICEFKMITDSDKIRFAEKMFGSIESQIRGRFDNYQEFRDFLWGKE